MAVIQYLEHRCVKCHGYVEADVLFMFSAIK